MRCFIAAWPDAETRKRLAELAKRLRLVHGKGTTMRAENLHLTLAFIGELAEPQAKAVALVCKTLRFAPFEWSIDTLGSFPRAQVAWAGGPAAAPLLELATATRRELDKIAIHYDPQPFVPHVTLLRNVGSVSSDGPLPEAIEWRIDDVDLFASSADERGVRYRRVNV